jgi:hypothetical protein
VRVAVDELNSKPNFCTLVPNLGIFNRINNIIY